VLRETLRELEGRVFDVFSVLAESCLTCADETNVVDIMSPFELK